MKRVIILKCDDWEACYVDGECKGQNHHLGEGKGKIHFLNELSKQYDFSFGDVKEIWANLIDENEANLSGCLPHKLSDLKSSYDLE